MYKRILVAVDGSKTSERGLDEAIRIARFANAQLLLVHVANELVHAPNYQTYEDIIGKLRANGWAILKEANTRAEVAGITCTCNLVEAVGGRAAFSIVDQARAWPADLIVMGTHGCRGIRGLAIGSDAELVLLNTPVPVLLVHDVPESN